MTKLLVYLTRLKKVGYNFEDSASLTGNYRKKNIHKNTITSYIIATPISKLTKSAARRFIGFIEIKGRNFETVTINVLCHTNYSHLGE